MARRPLLAHRPLFLAAGSALLLAGLATGCESAEQRAAEHAMEQAADRGTCAKDAQPLDRPYGDGFPESFPFPEKTVVYHYEDRGADGAIVTAVSSAPFQDVLSFLNHDAVQAGFAITQGETEEHDAEANWKSGDGYRGRWAIRESAECPGETVIQVLAAAS